MRQRVKQVGTVGRLVLETFADFVQQRPRLVGDNPLDQRREALAVGLLEIKQPTQGCERLFRLLLLKQHDYLLPQQSGDDVALFRSGGLLQERFLVRNELAPLGQDFGSRLGKCTIRAKPACGRPAAERDLR